MNISIKSRLSMEYGWDNSLINKMIKLYGEDYLGEREGFYDSLEDKLEEHQITPQKGSTIYSVSKNIMIVRMHGDALESFSRSVIELFKIMQIKAYASGSDTSSRMNWIFDALEIEAMVNSGGTFHKQLFSIIKSLPEIYKLSPPKHLQGESLVVGANKKSSVSVLIDIYRKALWNIFPVRMDINNMTEALEYLKNKYSKDTRSR